MIEVKNLTKRYGNNLALDNVSFSIEEGTIVGFLGPNGAGKSTTMNIVTGYLSSTEGTVTVSGYDILENPNEAKKLSNLSKGYKQRVGIAQALLGNPPVLILDEPTVGLDPKQIIEIRRLIKDLGRRHTVILSSHILSEVQAICERIIIINNGQVVADGATDRLAHDLSADHRLIVRIDGPENEVRHALASMGHVKEVLSYGEKERGVYEFSVETDVDYDLRRDLFALLARNGWPLLSLRNTDLTLEDVFLQLTSGDHSRISKKKMKGAERA